MTGTLYIIYFKISSKKKLENDDITTLGSQKVENYRRELMMPRTDKSGNSMNVLLKY